jgi:hypothetical protein
VNRKADRAVATPTMAGRRRRSNNDACSARVETDEA